MLKLAYRVQTNTILLHVGQGHDWTTVAAFVNEGDAIAFAMQRAECGECSRVRLAGKVVDQFTPKAGGAS